MVILFIILGVLALRAIYVGVVFLFWDYTVVFRQLLPVERKLLVRWAESGLTPEEKEQSEEMRRRRKMGLPLF